MNFSFVLLTAMKSSSVFSNSRDSYHSLASGGSSRRSESKTPQIATRWGWGRDGLWSRGRCLLHSDHRGIGVTLCYSLCNWQQFWKRLGHCIQFGILCLCLSVSVSLSICLSLSLSSVCLFFCFCFFNFVLLYRLVVLSSFYQGQVSQQAFMPELLSLRNENLEKASINQARLSHVTQRRISSLPQSELELRKPVLDKRGLSLFRL